MPNTNYFMVNKTYFNEISSPLDQFTIRNLISIDAPALANIHISLTNIGLYLLIAGWLTITYHLISVNNNKIVMSNW